MTQKLSPAAQAVAWAYDNTPERPTGNHRYHWLGYALRAAAIYSYCPVDRKRLAAIADELEAQ